MNCECREYADVGITNMLTLGLSINYVTPKGGRGGSGQVLLLDFYLLLNSIRILTESVTWREGGSKIAHFGVA